MSNPAAADFISLEGISSKNIFKVENVSPDETSGVIEEHGYYFLVKERKRRTAWHISKDAKRNISKILTQKAEEAVHVREKESFCVFFFFFFGKMIIKERKKEKNGRITTTTTTTKMANEAERAQELLNSALRYDDGNVNGLNLYGKLLCAASLYDEALHLYARCLSVDPTNLEALISRAMIYCRHDNESQTTPKYYEAEWHFKLAYRFHHNNVYNTIHI
ncbi:hypothetical protein RFI_32139 [Reticulomyxa filosa]|uniref:Uncharacterized protein n=1 Tax=Reticulomyxa filosa TaxID=46433 RepID=X6LVT1_RETFI|nr:hypothetical protein RFI_32139 [Reticulomyxa filosa]|eukprot:ETO05257.1 hypothetical protein RFI_32139 [Reticulomyxa filosa]